MRAPLIYFFVSCVYSFFLQIFRFLVILYSAVLCRPTDEMNKIIIRSSTLFEFTCVFKFRVRNCWVILFHSYWLLGFPFSEFHSSLSFVGANEFQLLQLILISLHFNFFLRFLLWNCSLNTKVLLLKNSHTYKPNSTPQSDRSSFDLRMLNETFSVLFLLFKSVFSLISAQLHFRPKMSFWIFFLKLLYDLFGVIHFFIKNFIYHLL